MLSKRFLLPLCVRVHTCQRLSTLWRPQQHVHVLSLQLQTLGCSLSTRTQERLQQAVQSTVTIPKVDLEAPQSPQLSPIAAEISGAGLEELLDTGSKLVKGEEAVLVVERLCELKLEDKFDLEAMLSDTRLKHIFSLLQSNIANLPALQIVTCIKALLAITDKDSFLLESLERQVLWSIRKWQIHNIIKLLEALHQHQETPFRGQMYNEVKSIIERRWVEISNPYDVVSLMYIFDKPKDRQLCSKIQERALDLIDTMVPSCLYKILYLLSRQKVRNTPLIRAAVYHLNKKGFSLEIFQLANILYACSTLSIYDENLLTPVLESVKEKISSIESPKTALMILKSVSILRWHQNEAVDAILVYLNSSLSKISVVEKTNLVLSLARMNHVGPATKKLVETFSDDDITEIKKSPLLFLDYVWSLCVLGYGEESMMASVLTPEFYTKFTDKTFDEFHRQAGVMKIVNIQSAAQLDLTGYSGPTLPTDWFSTHMQNLPKRNRPLSDSVVAALTSTAPVDRFTKINVLSPLGYLIDAEMFVNQSGEPQPYQKASEEKLPNTYRIGLKVLDFSDMTHKSVHPVGLHVMASRHLTKDGYTVVELPYHELSDKQTVVQKVQYIQSKVKQAVAPPTS